MIEENVHVYIYSIHTSNTLIHMETTRCVLFFLLPFGNQLLSEFNYKMCFCLSKSICKK